jgi:hypothetical protein
MSTTVQTIDQAKLDEFMGRFVGDLGAALSAALVVIGDRLGLYRAMGDGEPVSAEELARRTGTDARPGVRREPRLVVDPRARRRPGQARLGEVVTAGGFTRFRRATETPFNLVLEARP